MLNLNGKRFTCNSPNLVIQIFKKKCSTANQDKLGQFKKNFKDNNFFMNSTDLHGSNVKNSIIQIFIEHFLCQVGGK